MVPHNISDRSITFFAKGRPWTVSADDGNFDAIRALLIKSWDTDATPADDDHLIDELVALADVRVSIIRDVGELSFNDADQLTWNGQVLHNLWTTKILAAKAKGEPYQPIFNALKDLMTNPTPEAIERLPIFLERVGSGFLPDGRCTGFKAVRSDYKDCHSGTFDNAVGQHVAMDRATVNPNPNETCAAGLHIGALGYIKDYYFHSDNRVMFVAFWPRDVVSVPVDYNGSKMRVCAYDVLDEVEKRFVDDFLKRNATTVTGYVVNDASAPTQPALDPFTEIKAGQWFEHADGHVYKATEIDIDGGERVVNYRDHDGDIMCVLEENADDIVSILEAAPAPYQQVYEGAQIRVQGSFVRDGIYTVSTLDSYELDHPDERAVTITIDNEEITIRNKHIAEVLEPNEQQPAA